MQLSNQVGQPLVFGPIQQHVQPAVQTSTLGLVQQLRPSSSQTLPRIAATTDAFFVQPTTPVSGLSVAPVSTIPTSVQTPQFFVPKLGPTVQTLV